MSMHVGAGFFEICQSGSSHFNGVLRDTTQLDFFALLHRGFLILCPTEKRALFPAFSNIIPLQVSK